MKKKKIGRLNIGWIEHDVHILQSTTENLYTLTIYNLEINV